MWGSQSSDSVTPAPKPRRGPPPTSPAWETWTEARGQAGQDTGLEPSELTQIPAPESRGFSQPEGDGELFAPQCPRLSSAADNSLQPHRRVKG